MNADTNSVSNAPSVNCPKCGKPIPPDAPQTLCPVCVLANAAAASADGSSQPAAPAATIQELQTAFPDLEIIEFVGAGGMGWVYKTRQPKLDRLAALKLLPEALAKSPAFAERFNREARTLARLNHPNIVSVFDFGRAGGFYYLLMEFVDGVNLRQAMQTGKFSPAEALHIVPKICEALQYAHDEGVLHRDIKPENILLDIKGRVKIADFGIAKLLGDSQKSPALTASGAILGTPHYMAPEQIESPSQVDHRADIYSLGVVFYEMLTGELPLGRFAPPSSKTPLDHRVDEIVFRALTKERELRQQTASQIKTEIETVTGHPQPFSTPHSPSAGVPVQSLINTARSALPDGWLAAAGILLVGSLPLLLPGFLILNAASPNFTSALYQLARFGGMGILILTAFHAVIWAAAFWIIRKIAVWGDSPFVSSASSGRLPLFPSWVRSAAWLLGGMGAAALLQPILNLASSLPHNLVISTNASVLLFLTVYAIFKRSPSARLASLLCSFFFGALFLFGFFITSLFWLRQSEPQLVVIGNQRPFSDMLGWICFFAWPLNIALLLHPKVRAAFPALANVPPVSREPIPQTPPLFDQLPPWSAKALGSALLVACSLPVPILLIRASLSGFPQFGQGFHGPSPLALESPTSPFLSPGGVSYPTLALTLANIVFLALPGTVLGWMALSDLRHRMGKLRGLPAALFASLAWPILILLVPCFLRTLERLGFLLVSPDRSFSKQAMLPALFLNLVVLIAVSWGVSATFHWAVRAPANRRFSVLGWCALTLLALFLIFWAVL